MPRIEDFFRFAQCFQFKPVAHLPFQIYLYSSIVTQKRGIDWRVSSKSDKQFWCQSSILHSNSFNSYEIYSPFYRWFFHTNWMASILYVYLITALMLQNRSFIHTPCWTANPGIRTSAWIP